MRRNFASTSLSFRDLTRDKQTDRPTDRRRDLNITYIRLLHLQCASLINFVPSQYMYTLSINQSVQFNFSSSTQLVIKPTLLDELKQTADTLQFEYLLQVESETSRIKSQAKRERLNRISLLQIESSNMLKSRFKSRW